MTSTNVTVSGASWLANISVCVPIRDIPKIQKYAASLVANSDVAYNQLKAKRKEKNVKNQQKTSDENSWRIPNTPSKQTPKKSNKEVMHPLEECARLRKEAVATKSETLRRACLQRADELTVQYLSQSGTDVDSDTCAAESTFRRNEEIMRQRITDLKTAATYEKLTMDNIKTVKKLEGEELEEFEYKTRGKTPANTTAGIDEDDIPIVKETAPEKIARWSSPADVVARIHPQEIKTLLPVKQVIHQPAQPKIQPEPEVAQPKREVVVTRMRQVQINKYDQPIVVTPPKDETPIEWCKNRGITSIEMAQRRDQMNGDKNSRIAVRMAQAAGLPPKKLV